MNFASSRLKLGWGVPILLGCCILTLSTIEARAKLSNQQARKLITKMAGMDLPGSSVRIKNISESSSNTAEVTAEIKTVFRFEKDSTGHWRIREVRTGQDRWVPVSLIANALNAKVPVEECAAPDPPMRGSAVVDPSVKRSRCLLAGLLGVTLPSDLVRIQSVSPLGIPLASQPSAVVLTLITINTRMVSAGSGWQLAEVRAGSSDWIKVEGLAASLDRERAEMARGELAWMAEALVKFRKDRGFYLVSDSQSAVMDHLSPKYLPRIIRVDPWQRAYKYQGERERFVLRSVGADGKEGTGDDIELTSASR